MDQFFKEQTENTPKVILDHIEHQLEFEGDSRPEEVQHFYNPIMSWLDAYENYLYYLKDQHAGEISVKCNFKFEYFNSSSAKYVMDIIKKLKAIETGANNVSVLINWYYDEMDEDILDAGKEFEDMMGIPFHFYSL